MVNFGEVLWAQLAKIHFPYLHDGVLGYFKVSSDAKERVGCGKLPHLFIPCKTATLVLEFSVEDLPLRGTAALVPEFAVKALMMVMMMHIVKRWHKSNVQ